jgi:HAD superfamily hydrolase (TIGR01509 family)
MSLKALLFDCDGVIAETESDGHRVAFNEAFRRKGVDAFWDAEEYGRLLKTGGGKERMLRYFQNDSQKYPSDTFSAEYISELHKVKTAIFIDLCLTLPPRPGVRRIMLEAAVAGISVFICSTSNENSVNAIADAVLGDDKERVLTRIYAGDIVKAKKPAPDIYTLVPAHHDTAPEECLVIEDTRIGLLAAKAAGMRCLITRSMYSKGEDFSEAVAVVDNLGEREIPCRPICGLPETIPYITLDILRGLV